MRSFRWTEDATADLKALLAKGCSAAVIAERLGCGSRNAVLGKIMRLRDAGEILSQPKTRAEAGRAGGVAKRGRGCPGLAQVPQIRALWKEGHNDGEIARACGLKPDDVRYVRRVKKLKANDVVRKLPPYAAELARLVGQGHVDRQVAEALGITLDQARHERRRQGLTAPRVAAVTTISKGDPGSAVARVFSEGFMGQRSRVGLAQLAVSGMCRFPIDQPRGPVRYCGADTPEGKVYCAHHAARCYTVQPPRAAPRPSHVYVARR